MNIVRHSRESGNPGLKHAFKIRSTDWIPAFAGMTVLIVVHVYLALSPIKQLSPTYDEPAHLAAGVAALRFGNYNVLGHDTSPFAEMWAALPLLRTKPVLPVQHPAWIDQRWTVRDAYQFADAFLYHNRLSPEEILEPARKMQLLLSCGLGLTVMMSAFAMGGFVPALLSGVLWAFSPTVLANGTLVTTDLAFAAFFFAFFACFVRRGTRFFDVMGGCFLGLAFASKYFAISMLPILVVIAAVDMARGKSTVKSEIISLAINLGVALVVLSAVYRFSSLDVFWNGISLIVGRSQAGRSSFFLGRHGTQGWLLYFPFLLLAKTPLPLLIGLGAVLVGVILKKIRIPMALWFPPIAFLLMACVSKVQIGHRYLLALYPFLFVIVAVGLG